METKAITEEEFFDNYFDIFHRPGWEQLVSELLDNAKSINSVLSCKDENDLAFRRGQLNIINRIVNQKTFIEQQFQEYNDKGI